MNQAIRLSVLGHLRLALSEVERAFHKLDSEDLFAGDIDLIGHYLEDVIRQLEDVKE